MEETNEEEERFECTNRQQAFRRSLATFNVTPTIETSDLALYLKLLRTRLKRLFRDLLVEHRAVKIWVTVKVNYEKLKANNTQIQTEDEIVGYLASRFQTICIASDVEFILDTICEDVCNRNINFMRNASGLRIKKLGITTVDVSKFNPIIGRGYQDLPMFLLRKRAIVNVKNNDNRCFGYAILAALHPQDQNPNRPILYDPYFQQHNLHTLTYPVANDKLAEVERHIGIAINVYGFYDDLGLARYPIYVSNMNAARQVDLLYWNNHYAWIKNFSSFMFDFKNTHKGKTFWCKRCLGHFCREESLILHKQYCSRENYDKVMYTLPPEGVQLSFINQRYQQKIPFVVYADFECITESTNRQTAHSTFYQNHIPCSFGAKVVSTVDAFQFPYITYYGADVCTRFLAYLREVEKKCLKFLYDPKRMIFSSLDAESFNIATQCYICKMPFDSRTDKVRDHDHLTGKYRGAAHMKCNFQLQTTYKIPVFIHNFRGYDSHLIVHALQQFADIEVKVIGQGMEKYLQMCWGQHIVFKDSLQFLNCALATLVENLKRAGNDKFIQLSAIERDQEKRNLMLRKGVYPYDYMDQWNKFDERQLPNREEFRNKLRDNEECSTEDYNFANQIWNAFSCMTMKDYHDVYLKADVILLADVFEEFRNVCKTHYDLDPAHYVSAPQLSWDAMMKSTNCKLDLISDPEMYKMLDENLRGGICMITKRFAKANCPDMDTFNRYLPESYIMYLDANNLYGYAMSQSLPYTGFKWLKEEYFAHINWLQQEENQADGYIVECDLDYPKELHDEHNEYPLAPERVDIDVSMLGEKQLEIRRHYQLCNGVQTKLVPNLMDKTNYCCHYLTLKFYLEHGLVLKSVHRVIAFKQSKWLAPYISLNQQLRANANNDFEKDFFKLMVNAIYGKTCENLKKRTDIKLLTDGNKLKTLVEKPHCLGFRIFDENLAAVEMRKTKCMINKPFYTGFTVLELSKLHMYKFHYDYIKKKFPAGKSELLFTDTDSLMYLIECRDLYQQLQLDRELFDFSDYPRNSFMFDETNKKVLGKFKDEANGFPITEFVGLRPKMYSYQVEKHGDIYNKHRAKGIQLAVARKLRHDEYKSQLDNPEENYVTTRRIGSKLHKVYTVETKKRGLCAFDDKRFLLEDGINSLAYGHFSIPTIARDPMVTNTGNSEAQLTLAFEEAVRAGVLQEEVPEFPAGIDPTQIENITNLLPEHDLLSYIYEYD